MATSKSTRIIILLVIDTVFFLVELSCGYAVHSLALVADAFHMLNDVLSLCVGLWAVWAANQTSTPKTYTYGYQRAETLGALVNGVFLVALCVSIFLEAISRFVDPPEITNPLIVLIIGCLGLLSNLVGLFLFHDHSHGPGGHSHGPGGHSHGPGSHEHNHLKSAEEGQAHAHAHNHEHGHEHTHEDEEMVQEPKKSSWFGWFSKSNKKSSDEHDAHEHEREHDHENGHAHNSSHTHPHRHREASHDHGVPSSSRAESHNRSRTLSRGGINPEDAFEHGPSGFRGSIIAQANAQHKTPTADPEAITSEHDNDASSPLLPHTHPSSTYGTANPANGHARDSIDHGAHKHAQPREATSSSGGGHGHSHGDLNMRGIFLHVLGDALGNVGVILTGAFIMLTNFSWRFYFDPAISLVITCIILTSAIPLCIAASRILLQAVPHGIEVDDIRDDIEQLPGISSCHELHVWQLSDTKLVASLHVRVTFDFEGEGATRYMQLARAVRQCLHEYGIHVSTIQPEFHPTTSSVTARSATTEVAGDSPEGSTRRPTASSLHLANSSSNLAANPDNRAECLLDCTEDCGDGSQGCCPPAPPSA